MTYIVFRGTLNLAQLNLASPRTCRRGCQEDATGKLLPWNSGHTADILMVAGGWRCDGRVLVTRAREVVVDVVVVAAGVSSLGPSKRVYWSVVRRHAAHVAHGGPYGAVTLPQQRRCNVAYGPAPRPRGAGSVALRDTWT